METREILDDVMAFASILAVFVLALVQLVKNSINIPVMQSQLSDY